MKREIALQIVERARSAHLRLPELHAQRAHQVHFAQAVGRPQFVFRHAIGIQAAGQRPVVENGDRGARAARNSAAQASDAGPPPTQATLRRTLARRARADSRRAA